MTKRLIIIRFWEQFALLNLWGDTNQKKTDNGTCAIRVKTIWKIELRRRLVVAITQKGSKADLIIYKF